MFFEGSEGKEGSGRLEQRRPQNQEDLRSSSDPGPHAALAATDAGSRGEWSSRTRTKTPRGAVAELEHSVPEAERDDFRRARNAALVVNALLRSAYEVLWKEAESAINRIPALLSLGLLAETGQPGLLSGAAAPKTRGPTVRGASLRRRKKDSLDSASLLDEIGLFAGVMFTCDTSFSRPYWEETLGVNLPTHGPPLPVDLQALLAKGQEPFTRVSKQVVRTLFFCLQLPVALEDAIVAQPPPSLSQAFGFLLPPVDRYRARNLAVSEAIVRSRLSERLEKPTCPVPFLAQMHEMAEAPSRFALGQVVVDYKAWCYPKQPSEWGVEIIEGLVSREEQRFLDAFLETALLISEGKITYH